MANSKTSTGFDLVIGQLLNEGWERASEPSRADHTCYKCQSTFVELWELKRSLSAFGQTITQSAKAIVCPNCLHEVLIESDAGKKRKGPKRRSFSKEQKLKLIKFLAKLSDDELKKFLK